MIKIKTIKILPLVEFNKDNIKNLVKVSMPNMTITTAKNHARWLEKEILAANGIEKIKQSFTDKRKKLIFK